MKLLLKTLFPSEKKYSFTRIKAFTYLIMLGISLLLATALYPAMSTVNKFIAVIACIAIVLLCVVILGNLISSYIINDIKRRQF